MLIRVLFLILIVSVFASAVEFASAVDVNFDCPDEVYTEEEFGCSLEVFDGNGFYDIKVEADKERDSVLKIWDEEDGWKSGYYYLNEFIENENDGTVKLKILEDGKYDMVLKLRQGSFRREFDIGKIRVLVRENKSEGILDKETKDERVVDAVSSSKEREVISLNSKSVIEDNEWDYVSKDGKIVDWLPYGFSLFLIFLIAVLFWERSARY